MQVKVQHEAFDPGAELNALHAERQGIGAVSGFVGYVRDFNEGHDVASLFLEHYPGMTEKALHGILDLAAERWPLLDARILHRVGELQAGEPIVFVGTAAAHRQVAFDACQFIIDYLKTRAPFWKKESGRAGSSWVEGRDSDRQASERWSG